jgi:hypothetical protein
MSSGGGNSGTASGEIVAPSALAFLTGVCDAIEAFTKAQIERDPDVFRPRGIDLRHTVERHLYFEAINSPALRQLFTAASGGSAPRPREMPLLQQQLAPFLVKTWRLRGHWHRRVRLAWREPGWKSHREKFRAAGGARLERANWPQGQGVVLFQVVQVKFLPFLRPIAEALHRPYAFVVFDDPALFAQLEGLPRLGIRLNDAGRELLRIERFGLLEFFSTLLNGVVEALTEVRPACIVMPEGNSPYNELFSRAGHSLGIPSLCVQQGWSPIIHTGFRAMSYDRMCVWGTGFSEALAPFNPGQHFVVTGSHVLAPRLRAPGQSNGAIAFFLQAGGSPLITPAAAAGMLDLVSWAASQFPAREIRVRPHPGTPLTAAEEARLAANPNVHILPAGNAQLNEVLDCADIAVSIFSTTILEAAAAGVIPLIVNVAGLPHYNPDIAREGAAVEVKDFDAARQALSRLMEDAEFSGRIGSGLAGVAGRYFARGGSDAVSAIAAQINALATGAGD